MSLSIYFQSNKLQFTTNLNSSNIIVKEINEIKNPFFFKQFTESKNKTYCFLTEQPNESFLSFASSYHTIIACGGIVYNLNKELLMIYRKGVWDLPKGKLDPQESFEQCAVREVMEETGLSDCYLSNFATSCYHLYHEKNQWLLKETKWYYMSSALNQKLIPQAEEKIEKVEWCSVEKAKKRLQKSYRSFEEIIPLL